MMEIKNIKIGDGVTKICVSLMGKSVEDVTENANLIINDSGYSDISIIEVRADYFDFLDSEEEVKEMMLKLQNLFCDKILLFTIRSESEGGEHIELKEKTIDSINDFIISNKLADMVDIELFTCEKKEDLIKKARQNNVRIIMSNHDFVKTPSKEEIIDRLVKMQSMGADIVKIAVMPNSKEDLLTVLSATYEMSCVHPDTPVVTMSMSKLGAASRVVGEVFGNAITFGAVGRVSAPGQLPVSELTRMLKNIHLYCN